MIQATWRPLRNRPGSRPPAGTRGVRRQGEQKVHTARCQAREKRKPQQPDRHWKHANIDANQRERAEETSAHVRTGNGDGDLVIEGRSSGREDSYEMRFALDPRIRDPQRRPTEVPERLPVVRGERPECIVHLHLGDRDVIGTVVQHRCDDRSWFEDDTLKRQAFHRGISLTADQVGWSGPDDPREQTGKQDERDECEYPMETPDGCGLRTRAINGPSLGECLRARVRCHDAPRL